MQPDNNHESLNLPPPLNPNVAQNMPEHSGSQSAGEVNLPPPPTATGGTHAPSASAPTTPVPDPAVTQAAVAAASDDLAADDADLIEKEWVSRAKTIVEQTKNDPHLQNKQMNKMKAEYIKKRYNKDLKVSEG